MKESWDATTWPLGSLGTSADGSKFLYISEVSMPPDVGFPHAQPLVVSKVRQRCHSKPCFTFSPL